MQTRSWLVCTWLAVAGCASTPSSPFATMTPASVVGKRWVAEAAASEAERPRLEFQPDGRLAGYTGCNSLSGSWRVEDGVVRLGALAMTKRACLGPGGDLEKRFLAAVNAKTRLSVEGTRLVAQAEGGEAMSFVEIAAR